MATLLLLSVRTSKEGKLLLSLPFPLPHPRKNTWLSKDGTQEEEEEKETATHSNLRPVGITAGKKKGMCVP